ncbi:MAG: glucose-6-phosphate dehydrogenase [Proteobacteria bacterium]|nr:glucose-6-phosphate dehydrogenase [Pseudomonadota bacterium]MBU1649521.1 glucose-6-phosphate dehydrogenase [Pseudomonadota bacterium]
MAETVIKGKICDPNNICDCLTVGELDPCAIVIFGASGDLTARKLIPALYRMFLSATLPDPVSIVGCARTGYNHDTFRTFLQAACTSEPMLNMARWHEFADKVYYFPLNYDSLPDFLALAGQLNTLDQERGTKGNRLFDLALPPSLYASVATKIGEAGLARQFEKGRGWTRIVIEKPFGRDLDSALVLDQTLHQHFHEKQIFRIDHYLAKETVQNILTFRFANTIFEPIWNRGYIESVGIIAVEKLGVEHRSGYYEQAGVIRDMFQNHMLQLLSLIAMEPPSHFEAEPVRDEKIKLLRSIRPLHDRTEDIVLGQYGPGDIDGQEVPGYRQEPGVSPNSLIPTFAMLPVHIDNWRWQGVPFYLISGKRMARKETRIVIQFKDVPHSLFRDILGAKVIANRLVLGIYPKESISLTFQTKNPGARMCMRSMTMDFKYDDFYTGPSPEAYEKVLIDCIQGDHMLFWRQDGIEQSWSLLTPLLNECETCQGRAQRLHSYTAGSWGPDTARSIVEGIVT